MKKTHEINKAARKEIMKAFGAEKTAYASHGARQQALCDTLSAKVAGLVTPSDFAHALHDTFVQEGIAEVPVKYTDAINTKGDYCEGIKRLYDYVRNNKGGDTETKEFNPESYVKAVMKKCAENPSLAGMLEKALKAAKKAASEPEKAAA